MALKDKVALITGGCTEVGKATALQFAEAGARVLIVDADLAEVEETARLTQRAGGEVRAIASSADGRSDIKELVDAAVEAFGDLHYAVNNMSGELDFRLIHEIEEDGWDSMIDSTLKNVWLAMKYEIRAIKQSGGGAIVNVASASSITASPGLSAFGAAKAGVISLSKSAATELAQHNVRINSVSPGGVITESLERLLDAEPELKDSLESSLAMGRLAKPEEIASCIRFLCSDDSSFMTGDNLVVDGGGVMSRI